MSNLIKLIDLLWGFKYLHSLLALNLFFIFYYIFKMVVKKTTKKTTPVIKKTSPVIVETKKHEENCCGSKTKNCFTTLVIVLLILNLAVGIWNSLNSNSAWNIEALKVGWRENLELVKNLYKMDTYKEQQRWAIMQVINSFANEGLEQEMVLPVQEDVQDLPLEIETQ